MELKKIKQTKSFMKSTFDVDVTVAIPAYKPHYFAEALDSALAQEHLSFEVLVCDDSPGKEIESIVKSRQGGPVPLRYLRNHTNLGERGNVRRCIDESHGRFIKLLYDDDLIVPNCIARLSNVLRSNEDVTLVSSRRNLIDEKGDPVTLLPGLGFIFPFSCDTRVSGNSVCAFLANRTINFIGEPSSVMFRKTDVERLAVGDVFALNGQPIRWVGDLSLYVKLLKVGDLAILAEPLSSFRITRNQVSHQYRERPEIVYKHVADFQKVARNLAWCQGEERLACSQLLATHATFELDLFEYLMALDKKPQKLAPVRALAFYLPQFHEIPENNAWWGQGFTEWTNVRQARPLFEGHEQPLKPTELGYYDLSSVGVMERQAKLAREHGIHGFCFYYYWFDGRRLLEKPVDQLLQAPHINLPFCLCWANENWTRRWDGGAQDVLLPQSYSPDKHEQFARDLLPYLSDPRYICVDGKPVLLVYRTDIIPNLGETVAAWRAVWKAEAGRDVYLIAVESFRSIDPEAYGFDASCEFPPHQMVVRDIPPTQNINLISDPDANVGDYIKLRDNWLSAKRPNYKRFRGLIPGWDNTARRRKGGATLFVGSNPGAYKAWLTEAVRETVWEFKGDERLLFINAWNEWAEGCTLEPSQRWGRSYLEATLDVLSSLNVEQPSFRTKPYWEWLLARRGHFSGTEIAERLEINIGVVVAGDDQYRLQKTRESLAAQLRMPREILNVKEIARLGDARWTLLLNAGDWLEPDALFQLEKLLQRANNGSALVIYLDHDELDEDGDPVNPLFKPDLSYDSLLSYPYIGRAIVVRNDWARRHLLAEKSLTFDICLAYRLALQATLDGGEQGVIHLPSSLLHLDRSEPAVFCTTTESWQALAGVLMAHLAVKQPGAQVLEGPGPGTFHVIHPLLRTPKVSIVIPTRDQLPFLSRCIETLLEKTDYPDFEILVVDNDSQTPESQAFLSGLEGVDPERIRVLRVPGVFNFSRMNNLAVAQARGEFILLLNNDTAVLHADWLSHMMRHALRDCVGIVGARLLYPEGTVQHAGVIMGLRGPAEHPCLGLKADEPGYMFRAQLTQNFSAVTAACMLVSKAVYQKVGGLDEDVFAVSYNDVDFCLRVGKTGRRIVWTPLATLLHEGSASQKADIENIANDKKAKRFTREQAAMYERWPDVIANDPAYNPNLSLVELDYGVETNPLLGYDPLKGLVDHRVVAFAADAYGCGNYRILQPMQAMLEAGLCSGGASPELFGPNLALRSGADTLVFQRPSSDSDLALLESLLPLRNIKKIYEVDDDLSRVPMKSAHREHMPKDIRARMMRNIGLCDRLVVSTDTLAHRLRGSNDDIRVVLNRLPPAMWGDVPPAKQASEPATSKPRVGWAGGISHQGDLELIAQVVRDTADQVDWIFFGMCPEVIRPYVKEFYAGVPTLDYPKRLMELAQSWDLAVAPLEINPFNESKSNLRLLEYGWCGLPVVCSDITPYQGDLPVRRVKNRYKDWRAAILDAVNARDASREMGQLLQQRIHADWMLKGDNLREWYEAWTGD